MEIQDQESRDVIYNWKQLEETTALFILYTICTLYIDSHHSTYKKRMKKTEEWRTEEWRKLKNYPRRKAIIVWQFTISQNKVNFKDLFFSLNISFH